MILAEILYRVSLAALPVILIFGAFGVISMGVGLALIVICGSISIASLMAIDMEYYYG